MENQTQEGVVERASNMNEIYSLPADSDNTAGYVDNTGWHPVTGTPVLLPKIPSEIEEESTYTKGYRDGYIRAVHEAAAIAHNSAGRILSGDRTGRVIKAWAGDRIRDVAREIDKLEPDK